MQRTSSRRVNTPHTRNANVSMPIDVRKFRHKVDNFWPGSVSRCLKSWKALTNDKWILALVKGYKIEFKADPWQSFRPKPLRLNAHDQALLDNALEEFLHLGIIEPCDYNDEGFYSTLFPVAKRDKTARVIFDL